MSQSDWVYSPVVVDKSLLDRILQGSVDNFLLTNRILYEWGGGGVSNYLFNKSKNNFFFKEPRASILKIAIQSLGKVLGVTPKGFNFGSMGPFQAVLTRAVAPAVLSTLYFEIGIAVGSVATVTVEEVYKDLRAYYISEYGEEL